MRDRFGVMKRSIHSEIEEIIGKHFPKGAVRRVRLKRGEDHEGSPVYRVVVVYGNTQPLDRRLTTSLTRVVRKRLSELGDEIFPVIGFVSEADDRSMKTEAA